MINKFLQLLSDKIELSEDKIEKIRKLYNNDRINFIESLVASGMVQEELILQIISDIYSISYIGSINLDSVLQGGISSGLYADKEKLYSCNLSFTQYLIKQGFTENISIHFLKKYCIVPALIEDNLNKDSLTDSSIVIAVNNPCELSPADDIANFLNLPQCDIVLAPRSEILSAINHLYNQTTEESARQIVENMEENGTNIIKAIEETSDLLDNTSDAPVIRLVNHIISQSVKANASDIHIEPFQDTIKIRYRIDGILQEKYLFPSPLKNNS